MKKQLVQWAGMGVWIVACLSACAPIKTEVGNLNVIPQPQEVRQDMQGNPFVVNSQTCIVYPESNEKMERTAAFLASYIKEATGTTVCTTTRPKEKNSIILGIDPSITHKEGYRLAVTADNIRLTGGSEAGVFYGIQTLYKALPPTKGREVSAAIPAGEVSDYPRFGYRGFMVDVGRHYFPVSYLKQIIDMLALHNINYFHWHLTEDQGWRIEIKKYPKLTEIGSVRPRTLIDWGTMAYDETPHSGFYTQEEAREIVRYAADRFITVIPEIDLPGHMMGALASYPELGCTGGPYEIPCKWGVFPDVLCGGNEQALQLAKDVWNARWGSFPSP